MDEAILHCTRGIGIWDWASNDQGGEPDVVIACAGDIPTLEALAAVDLLRQHLPDLKVRFVNVVDLMRLQAERRASRTGCRTTSSTRCSRSDKPIVFAYHGYPWLIHRLTYRRTNHAQPPRPRLQGGGHDHDAVRHGHAQRPRPVPPRDRRHRPGARARVAGRARPAADGRQADRGPGVHPARGRGRAGDRGLGVAGLRPWADPRRQRGIEQPQAPGPRPGRRRRRRGGPAGDRGVDDAATRRRRDRRLGGPVDAVGHRVVHGGTRFTAPVVARRGVARRASRRSRRSRRSTSRGRWRRSRRSGPRCPDVPHVACFDTAFHATMPEAAATYAIPAAWRERWRPAAVRVPRPVARVRLAAGRGAAAAGRATRTLRVVTCHLGAGASLAAVLGGRSVDTTMGFTPLEGLVMATRSGSIDPGTRRCGS